MTDALHRLATTRAARAAFTLGMIAGTLAIGWASLPYFDERDLHPFVAEKLPLPHEDAWLGALEVHVVAALFALPACLLLLWQRLRARAPRLHRWLGRLTALVLLGALVPSGFVLALVAKGGLAGTLGFALSGAIVVVAMPVAIMRARARDDEGHRHAVRHVVAQLSVAVTSRAMLWVFGLAGATGDTAYLVSLWVPVIGSAALVEAVRRRPAAANAPRPRRLVPATFCVALLAVLAVARPGLRDTATAETAEATVNSLLIRPLERAEAARASRFSRAGFRMPLDRRARVADTVASRDAAGGEFFRFAIDSHHAFAADPAWQEDVIVGCVYPTTHDVFVCRDGSYEAATILLGARRPPPPAHVCMAAPGRIVGSLRSSEPPSSDRRPSSP